MEEGGKGRRQGKRCKAGIGIVAKQGLHHTHPPPPPWEDWHVTLRGSSGRDRQDDPPWTLVDYTDAEARGLNFQGDEEVRGWYRFRDREQENIFSCPMFMYTLPGIALLVVCADHPWFVAFPRCASRLWLRMGGTPSLVRIIHSPSISPRLRIFRRLWSSVQRVLIASRSPFRTQMYAIALW